jgi:hypothetical protein
MSPRPEHTREALIVRAQKMAGRLGKERLSLTRFCDESGINCSRVYARFGSWHSLCLAAGIESCGKRRFIPAETLLEDLYKAIIEAGGVENRRRLQARIRWSGGTYIRRFGDWLGALTALKDWLDENVPDFPYGDELDRRITDHAQRMPYRRTPKAERGSVPVWRSTGVRACGAPLAFRALTHAPVNELGVVFLFGMVAGDLGYAVDYVGAAFPDCIAKRLVVDGPRDADARWEPVRIEFEYRSRNFFYHGHDAASCDVVVCWQHDWTDCPIEVLELKRVVARMISG